MSIRVRLKKIFCQKVYTKKINKNLTFLRSVCNIFCRLCPSYGPIPCPQYQFDVICRKHLEKLHKKTPHKTMVRYSPILNCLCGCGVQSTVVLTIIGVDRSKNKVADIVFNTKTWNMCFVGMVCQHSH